MAPGNYVLKASSPPCKMLQPRFHYQRHVSECFYRTPLNDPGVVAARKASIIAEGGRMGKRIRESLRRNLMSNMSIVTVSSITPNLPSVFSEQFSSFQYRLCKRGMTIINWTAAVVFLQMSPSNVGVVKFLTIWMKLFPVRMGEIPFRFHQFWPNDILPLYLFPWREEGDGFLNSTPSDRHEITGDVLKTLMQGAAVLSCHISHHC